MAELQFEGDTVPVDLHDLDDRITRGEVPGSARLRHAPWTGELWMRLDEIPDLKASFAAPGARMAAHFEHPPWAWLSISVSLFVLLMGALQVASEFGLVPLLGFFNQAAVGFDEMAFDGRFWAPFSSQLVHANFALHLLGNLSVIVYSGYRVERALGRVGYAQVALSSILVGALAVALSQRIPVIGSSILAFGLLGAQLSIGFRFGDTLPLGQQRFYGFGNLLFAFILVANTLTVPEVSHAAHAGGFIGGALAAFLGTPLFLMRDRSQLAVLKQVMGLVLPAALSLSLGPILRLMPGAMWASHQVDLPEVGASLVLPGRLIASPGYEMQVRGMPAWTTSPNSDELLFCGLAELRLEASGQGDPLVGERLEKDWGRLIDGTAREVAPPPSRGPAWTAHALEFVDEDGVPRYRLVEHHRVQGVWVNRVGYLVSLRADGTPGLRAQVFEQALASVSVGEPPELAQARDAHIGNPTSEKKRFELAQALYRYGDYEQADALYQMVISQGGQHQGAAVVERLQMAKRLAPALDEQPWFMPWVLDYPGDQRLAVNAVAVLAAGGRCDLAREVHEQLAAARPDSVVLVTTAADVLACEG